MEERQVTVEGNTIKLERPFFVIATQNPIEQFGTFPLPEAQLDRFFIKLSLGYPEFSEEKDMLDRFMQGDPLNDLSSVVSEEEIAYVQDNFIYVHISDEIKSYILQIIVATRKDKYIEVGCSPRASLNLMKGSQALAAIKGRDYVIPEDVKEMAVPILSHRLVLRNEMNASSNQSEELITKILNTVKTPLEEV